MELWHIIAALVLYAGIVSITALIAVFAVGFQYGSIRVLNKMMLDAKRRERRFSRELSVIHNKLSEKAGIGSLFTRKQTDTPDYTPKRRVTPPSETIANLKNAGHGTVPKHKETVPAGIKTSFLNGADFTGEKNHG